MFADNLKMYRAVPRIGECEELQSNLTCLEIWAKDWLLQLNTPKCKVTSLDQDKENSRSRSKVKVKWGKNSIF